MKKMMATIAAITLATSSIGVSADEFTKAMESGKFMVKARFRGETVDDSVNEEASALTLRTRLGYTTGAFKGFKATAEISDTRIVGGQGDYAPEESGFAIVADPELTEVNLANVSYTGPSGFVAVAGRQRIILDNARFVGNVGWRQKEQTFDAGTLKYAPSDKVQFGYSYVDRVKGITPAFDADVSHHLANASWSSAVGKLTAYAYLLEQDVSGAENDTVGLRYKSRMSLDSVTLDYTLEYADQSAGAFDASYYLAEIAAKIQGVTFRLGHEVLTSDDGLYGTQTPLATKHAFNGWADKFLGTPATGLEDSWVGVAGKVGRFGFNVTYHDFSPEFGGGDYGSEIDAVVSTRFADHYTVGLKLADYNSDGFSADTSKTWLWLEANF